MRSRFLLAEINISYLASLSTQAQVQKALNDIEHDEETLDKTYDRSIGRILNNNKGNHVEVHPSANALKVLA